MLLVNETPFSAAILTTVLDADRMMASIIARITYVFPEPTPLESSRDVSTRGDLTLSPVQPWPVSLSAWDSPQGSMEEDSPFMRGGVDLFLFGMARAARRVPVAQMEVALRVGDFERRAFVVGERIWIREGRRLVPSSAVPFVELPLTLAYAFGGVDSWDGLELPWPENPTGLGFFVEEAHAEGRALPRIEEPDQPMTSWDQRPTPCGVGFCPKGSTARLRNGTVISDSYEIEGIRPQMFNSAYPRMIAGSVQPGDRVRVEGMLHDATVELTLPAPPFTVRLAFGSTVAKRVPSIDQIGIEVDERRVFVTYRFPFRYTVRAREFRQATMVVEA